MDLTKLKTELDDLEAFLARPDAFSDPDFASKGRRAAEIRAILDTDTELTTARANLEEAKELTNDPERGELARGDVEQLTAKIVELEGKLEEMLL